MNSEIRPAKRLNTYIPPFDSGIESITPVNLSRRPQRWQFKLLRFLRKNMSNRHFSVSTIALKSETE